MDDNANFLLGQLTDLFSADEKRRTDSGSVPEQALGEREARSDSLPCLSSNICTESESQNHHKERIRALCGLLAPYQKKQAHTLFSNVERLINEAPSVGHVGFFTLTTKDITDKSEFSRRWHSMLTHYWSQSPNFGHWIGCFEQQSRGAWHLHILVILPYDIRTGVDFEAFAQGHYKSGSPYLRSVWRELRGACIRYGFGRHELLPIKSNAEGMARYIGKYVSKHMGQREESAKGKRLVTSSQGWAKNSINFAWFTEGSREWRRKVEKFARIMGCEDLGDLCDKFGSSWAFKYIDSIYDIDEFAEYLNEGVPF